MWTFWVEVKSVHVVYRLFMSVLLLDIQLSKQESVIPFNRFNPVIILWLSQARTWNSNAICFGPFYIQGFEKRGDCSSCWYWWDWWPSLFKRSFHIQLVNAVEVTLQYTGWLSLRNVMEIQQDMMKVIELAMRVQQTEDIMVLGNDKFIFV